MVGIKVKDQILDLKIWNYPHFKVRVYVYEKGLS
jgi:hypothetical protein